MRFKKLFAIVLAVSIAAFVAVPASAGWVNFSNANVVTSNGAGATNSQFAFKMGGFGLVNANGNVGITGAVALGGANASAAAQNGILANVANAGAFTGNTAVANSNQTAIMIGGVNGIGLNGNAAVTFAAAGGSSNASAFAGF